MNNDTHAVSLVKVLEFLRDIGLDPINAADLRSVHIDPGVVTVVRYRRGEQGKPYFVGDEPDRKVATETVTIGIVDEFLPPEFLPNPGAEPA